MNEELHNLEDALELLDCLEHEISSHGNWTRFARKAKDALLRLDNTKLEKLIKKERIQPEWARLLFIGYSMIAMKNIDRGYPILLDSYKLKSTELALRTLFDIGMETGKYDEVFDLACEDLQRQKPLKPRESRLIRAWIYRQRGDLEFAERDYQMLLDTYPSDNEILLSYARFQSDNIQYERAVAAYDRVKTLEPEMIVEQLQGLAYCLSELGNYTAALNAVKRGLLVEPDDAYLQTLQDHITSYLEV